MPRNKCEKTHEGMEIVFVGSFNPAIFHPEWFLRRDLIQKDSKPKVSIVTSDVTQIELDSIHIDCIGERLIIKTADPISFPRLHDLGIGILRLLPHTPISSFGLNHRIHWKLLSDKYWHKIGHTIAPKDPIWNGLLDAPGMRSLKIFSPRVENPNSSINIAVEPSTKVESGLYVSVNLHFNLNTEDPNISTTKQCETLITNEWKEAEQWGDKVSAKIFESIPEDE